MPEFCIGRKAESSVMPALLGNVVPDTVMREIWC